MFVEHILDRLAYNYDTFSWLTCQHEVDLGNQVVCFYLYNQSGQIVGFQQYKWKAPKKHSNELKPADMKYFTHCKDNLGVFGIDSWCYPHQPLIVVEGIWEQLRIQKYVDCVAALCNNPKHLNNWLSCQPRETVAICQNDKAGHKLAKSCDRAIFLPDGVDTDELSELDLIQMLEENELYA